MADIAQEWRDLALDQKQDVYEFTRAGYHLSMDAAGEFGEELSFILWRVEEDGLQPMLTGQTRRSRLLISEPEYANEQVKVEAIIRSMISGERPVPRYDEHDDYDDTEPMVPPQREQRRARR
ncbi:MAG TPA: hypothetical protein VGT61_06790 [Thermomicrobiales bacterium]|nr:hypothetical protein [Thermomicrobiales bacterium]